MGNEKSKVKESGSSTSVDTKEEHQEIYYDSTDSEISEFQFIRKRWKHPDKNKLLKKTSEQSNTKLTVLDRVQTLEEKLSGTNGSKRYGSKSNSSRSIKNFKGGSIEKVSSDHLLSKKESTGKVLIEKISSEKELSKKVSSKRASSEKVLSDKPSSVKVPSVNVSLEKFPLEIVSSAKFSSVEIPSTEVPLEESPPDESPTEESPSEQIALGEVISEKVVTEEVPLEKVAPEVVSSKTVALEDISSRKSLSEIYSLEKPSVKNLVSPSKTNLEQKLSVQKVCSKSILPKSPCETNLTSKSIIQDSGKDICEDQHFTKRTSFNLDPIQEKSESSSSQPMNECECYTSSAGETSRGDIPDKGRPGKTKQQDMNNYNKNRYSREPAERDSDSTTNAMNDDCSNQEFLDFDKDPICDRHMCLCDKPAFDRFVCDRAIYNMPICSTSIRQGPMCHNANCGRPIGDRSAPETPACVCSKSVCICNKANTEDRNIVRPVTDKYCRFRSSSRDNNSQKPRTFPFPKNFPKICTNDHEDDNDDIRQPNSRIGQRNRKSLPCHPFRRSRTLTKNINSSRSNSCQGRDKCTHGPNNCLCYRLPMDTRFSEGFPCDNRLPVYDNIYNDVCGSKGDSLYAGEYDEPSENEFSETNCCKCLHGQCNKHPSSRLCGCCDSDFDCCTDRFCRGDEECTCSLPCNDNLELAYQYGGKYPELVDELEESITQRNKERFQRSMKRFEMMSRQDGNFDRSLFESDDECSKCPKAQRSISRDRQLGLQRSPRQRSLDNKLIERNPTQRSLENSFLENKFMDNKFLENKFMDNKFSDNKSECGKKSFRPSPSVRCAGYVEKVVKYLDPNNDDDQKPSKNWNKVCYPKWEMDPRSGEWYKIKRNYDFENSFPPLPSPPHVKESKFPQINRYGNYKSRRSSQDCPNIEFRNNGQDFVGGYYGRESQRERDYHHERKLQSGRNFLNRKDFQNGREFSSRDDYQNRRDLKNDRGVQNCGVLQNSRELQNDRDIKNDRDFLNDRYCHNGRNFQKNPNFQNHREQNCRTKQRAMNGAHSARCACSRCSEKRF